MAQLLYVPGFQEEKTGRPVGPVIQDYCKNNGIDFFTLDLPGDTDSHPDTETEFSLTALKDIIKEKITSILDNSKENLNVVAYSLSTRPTIDAILELSEEYRSRINLSLLHPAYNPLHSIRAMGAIRNEDSSELQNEGYYLNGNIEIIFNELILNWNGNAKQFQQDLKRYHNAGVFTYDEFLDYLKKLSFNVQIIGEDSSKDSIIHDNGPVKYTKRTAVQHLPKKMKQLLKFFNN